MSETLTENQRNLVVKRAAKYTAQNIIDAIRQNGYRQYQGAYITKDEDGEIAACAYGQAALNLAPKSWSMKMKQGFASALHSNAQFMSPAFGDVVTLNDGEFWDLQKIADYLDLNVKNKSATRVSINSAD